MTEPKDGAKSLVIRKRRVRPACAQMATLANDTRPPSTLEVSVAAHSFLVGLHDVMALLG